MSSRIIINGQSFTSNSGNIVVSNNKIVIDGKDVSDSFINDRKITVSIVGNIDSLTTTSGDVTVNGNVNDVVTTSGDVFIENGSVSGNVKTISGDVKCNSYIGGNVKTVSGDIKYRKNLKDE